MKPSKPEVKNAWGELAREARYFPALLAALVLAFLLLFFKDLGDPWRRYLVAALAVYAVGAGVIAHVNAGASYRQNPIRWGWLIAVWILHAAWFIWLMAYLFRRDVL